MARDVKIAILGDARDFSRAVGSANRDAGSLGTRMSQMSGRAKAAFAGLGVAAVAFGKTSVDAFMEAEVAQASLTAAYEKFPQLAGENADALRDLNTELARKTKFDDDATASSQAVLAQFGLTQEQLIKITPLLQDYAEKTGKDLPTAATDLGKAVLGQGRALKAVGLNLTDTGTAAGNFDQLMAGLTDKVGGFAEVAGGTTAGKVAILRNQFGELQERIGSALIPIITKLADALAAVMRWIEENRGTAQALAAVVGGILTAAFVAWGVSVIAATWPIILIGAAIAALVAGVIYAYTHWGWFKDAVDAVARFLTQTLWPALQRIWSFIKDNLIPIIAAVIRAYIEFYTKVAEVAGNIIRVWVGVVQWFAGLPDAIGGFAADTWAAMKKGLRAAVDWILDQLDRILGPLDEIAGKVGGVVGGLGGSISGVLGGAGGLLGFDSGGVVPGPRGSARLVLAHGGETILPTHKTGATTGGGLTVNYYGRMDQPTMADFLYGLRKTQLEMAE